MLSKLPGWVKNKYLLAIAVFAFVMLFMDKNDLFTQASRKRQLREYQDSKAWYEKGIETERARLEQLKSNKGKWEQYAREKHLMKKENEDLFLISEKPKKQKN